MTLPITDSMLRGELRLNVLAEIKDDQKISRLWANLHKWEDNGNESLIGIEKALVDAVEKSGLVKVSEVYHSDRKMRQGAEAARAAGLLPDNPDFTRVGEPLSLEGVFTPFRPLTPTDRFRHLLLRLECRRTMKCLKDLVMTMHDDGIVRTEVIQLFTTIKQFCEDTDEDFIRKGLTQFYFEIYHTFHSILEKGESTNYETDFQNFVYEWDGQFPDDDTIKRYEEKVTAFKPVIVSGQKLEAAPLSSEQPPHAESPVIKDKFEKFLEAAEERYFSLLPMVKNLGSPQKTMKLVRCMLQDMGSVINTHAHTAAMLEFLGFRKWYSYNYEYWSTKEYDKWCTMYVMNKQAGDSFKHYRLSVNIVSKDTSKDNYRYKGWIYKDSVEQEYNDIRDGKA